MLLGNKKILLSTIIVSLGAMNLVYADSFPGGGGHPIGPESISIGSGTVFNQVGIGLGYKHEIKSNNGISIGGWSKLGEGADQAVVIGVSTYAGKLTPSEEEGEIPKETPSKVVNKSEVLASGNYIPTNTNNPSGPTVPTEDKDRPAMQSIAIGSNTRVYGYTAIGLGQAVRANGRDSVSIGKASRVFLDNGIAVGSQAISAGKGSISMGRMATSLGYQSMSFGERSEVGTNATNSMAIGRWARTKNANSVVLGSFSSTEGDATPIDGTALFSGDNVNGKSGVISVGTDPYEIPFSNDKMIIPEFKRRIANVAGGIKDNDAVNVKQLSSVVTAIGLTPDEVTKIATNTQDKPKTILERIEDLKVQGAGNMEGVNQAMNRANDAYDTAVHAGANAAALAALKALPYEPNEKLQFMAGYGNYKGASSVALGLGYHQNKDRFFNAAVGLGKSAMWNAGVTIRIGSSNTQPMVSNEKYNDLEKKYENLKAELEALKAYVQSHT